MEMQNCPDLGRGSYLANTLLSAVSRSSGVPRRVWLIGLLEVVLPLWMLGCGVAFDWRRLFRLMDLVRGIHGEQQVFGQEMLVVVALSM
jgi:hypothetical protein